MVGQVLGLYQKFIGQNPTHQGHVVEVVLPIVMNSQILSDDLLFLVQQTPQCLVFF